MEKRIGYPCFLEVVDKSRMGNRWEGLRDVEEQDGGMLVPSPGILDLLDKVEDGVGGVVTWSATEVGGRKEVVLFGEHSEFPGHEGFDDFAHHVFQCNRAICLRYTVVGFAGFPQGDSFEVLPHVGVVS